MKPSNITVKSHVKSGNFSPIIKAIIILPKPEKQPFIVTISIGSLLLNIFVQLFSKPQQVEAAKTTCHHCCFNMF